MLFDIESINKLVKIDDFRKNFNTVYDFKDRGVIVSKYNKFPSYYLSYIASSDTCLYYTQYQEFLWAVGDTRFKYLEIEFEDKDRVCIFYKNIFYMNVKSIKMYDLPVSKNNNIKHIREVIEILFSKEFHVTAIVSEPRLLKEISNLSELNLERHYMSDNFYSNLDYMNKRMNSKFRSKYSINHLKEHLTYEFFTNYLDDNHKNLAMDILNEWSKHKDKGGKPKQFKGILDYSSDNINYLYTYYNNDPVSVSVFLNAGKYFIEEFCFTKVRTEFEDKQKHKDLNKLVFYIKYLELNFMKEKYNVDTIFMLGSADTSPTNGLYLNKKENNLGFIKDYILKKEDISNINWKEN